MKKKKGEDQDTSVKNKIQNDEDFIVCNRYKNSLELLSRENPDGIKDEKIAKYLMINIEAVNEIYIQAIEKIKKGLGL